MVTRRARFRDDDVTLHHLIWCPGCDALHAPRSRIAETAPDHVGPLWEWDGNTDAPTFSPSLLVYMGGRDGARNCHSFIRAGRWEFLSDSWHPLAGQTVPMIPVPDWVAEKD
jgi:hypothetical protein